MSSTSPTPKTFKLSPPSRQVLSRKLAAKLFEPLSQQPYTTINLSGAALGDAAVSQAGPHLIALGKMKCLETVILSDIVASLSQEDALRSLNAISSSIGICKQLRSVDLSHNALGSNGIAACRALLAKQPHLEKVFLSEAGLAAESVRLLCDFLQPCVNNLRVLDIHGNRVESVGLERMAALIEKTPRIQRLRLSSLGASPSAICTLARALRVTNSLAELDLSDNRMDTNAASLLADVLSNQSNLSRLALSDLNMGIEALHALLTPLAQASHGVAELLLAGNELSCEAVPTLRAYIVAHATSLRVLDVSHNELGGDGITTLAKAFKDSTEQPALTRLLVAHNEATPLSIVLLAQNIVKLPALCRFDVRGTDLALDTVQILRNSFRGADVLADERQESTDEVIVQSALQTLSDIADIRGQRESKSEDSAPRSTMSKLVSMFSQRTSEEEEVEDPAMEVRQISEAEALREPGSATHCGVSETATFAGESATPINDEMYTPSRASTTTTNMTPECLEQDIIQSARKLKRTVASLNREVFDATGELKLDEDSEGRSGGAGTIYSKRGDDGEDYELISDILVDRQKQGWCSWFVELLGGLLFALFLIMLILGVMQWQEDVVPSLRPM
ncbi:unnamed protein product [Agarophyton chilense]